jgi:hypothetical protein
MKKIYLLALLVITLASCKKISKPTASFDKIATVAYIGDVVTLASTSTNADSYLWMTTDGTTDFGKESSFRYQFNKLGNVDIILRVYSKKRKYLSEQTASVKVYGSNYYTQTDMLYDIFKDYWQLKAVKRSDASGVYYEITPGGSSIGAEEQQIIIGKKYTNNTLTSLSTTDFDNLFSVHQLNQIGSNDSIFVGLQNFSSTSSFQPGSGSIFKIINVIPYKNGVIVEANYNMTFPVSAYDISNGYLSFYVER